MMPETEIIEAYKTLIEFLKFETMLLRAHQMDKALDLIGTKEQLHLNFMRIKDALKRLSSPSRQFLITITHSNQLLKEAALENQAILEIVLSAHSRVLNAVVDKLNEKNRPASMYTSSARAMNLNKSMPSSIALNEKL